MATLDVVQAVTGAYASGKRPGSLFYFLNITRDFVVGAAPLPTPSDIAVLEVQPDVFADAEVRAGALGLRRQGFGVALDRYVVGDWNNHDTLLQVASHVKLDIEGTEEAVLRNTARLVRASSNAVLVGARIGNPRLYDLAREIGCELFQGYALENTEQRVHNTIRGSLAAYVEVLQLLAGDEHRIDLAAVTKAIMRDPDLSMRVLLACNSAELGTKLEITSIRQAVVLLGIEMLRRRVQLAIAQGPGVERGEQLTEMIVFATLAESLGTQVGLASGTGFLVGLLGEVAEALETPLTDLAAPLPLAPDLASALSGRTGPAGQVLTIVEAYKEGTSIPEPFTLTRLAALHARAMVTATGTVAAPRRGSRSTGTAAFPPISRQSDLPVSAPRAAVPAPAPVTAVFTDPPPTDHELAEARSGMRAIAGAPSIASSS